jgi:hypothetical protein
MSGRKVRESNINLEECYKLVRQSGSKGMRAAELARKMRKDKSTIYDYLNTLEMRGKLRNSHGLWNAMPEQTTESQNPAIPLEKEYVIELPLPMKEWQRVALMKMNMEKYRQMGFTRRENLFKTFFEAFNETRIIRIKGKNADDADMEKMVSLVKQATEKSSKFNLKGLLKGLIKSQEQSKSEIANSAESKSSGT